MMSDCEINKMLKFIVRASLLVISVIAATTSALIPQKLIPMRAREITAAHLSGVVLAQE
jgi:hypothetical protein